MMGGVPDFGGSRIAMLPLLLTLMSSCRSTPASRATWPSSWRSCWRSDAAALQACISKAQGRGSKAAAYKLK
jgi:hypothetical protein